MGWDRWTIGKPRFQHILPQRLPVGNQNCGARSGGQEHRVGSGQGWQEGGPRASYRIPQPLQVGGLQHESIEHLLGLPPHVQQD